MSPQAHRGPFTGRPPFLPFSRAAICFFQVFELPPLRPFIDSVILLAIGQWYDKTQRFRWIRQPDETQRRSDDRIP